MGFRDGGPASDQHLDGVEGVDGPFLVRKEGALECQRDEVFRRSNL